MTRKNIMNRNLVICAILLVFVQSANSCIATGYVPCCEGYMLNTTTGDCTKCPVGFTGSQCKLPCPFPMFPSFGDGCQSVCDCTQNLCSVSTGCQTPLKNLTADPSTKISLENISSNSTAEFIATEKYVLRGGLGFDAIILMSSLLVVVALGLILYGGYKCFRNTTDREISHDYQSTGRLADDCEVEHPYDAVEMGSIS